MQINILFADTALDQKANDGQKFIFNTLLSQSTNDFNNSHNEILVDHSSLIEDYLENFEILPKLTTDGYYIQIYQNPSNSPKFLGSKLPQCITELMLTINFDDDTSESIDVSFLDEFGNLPHLFVGEASIKSIEITAMVKENSIKNISTDTYHQMNFFAIKPNNDPKNVSILLPNYPSREKIKYIQGINVAGEKISAKNSSTRALNIQRSDSFMISTYLQLLDLYNSNLIKNVQEWESLYEQYQTQQDNRYLFTTYEHKLIFEEPVIAIHIELENSTQSTKKFFTTIYNQYRKSAPSKMERWIYLLQSQNTQ